MVEAHTESTKRLTVLASQKGASLPQMMPPPEQEMMSSLESARGAAFDRRYAAMQVRAHNAAASVFRAEASDGTDPDLRGFAQRLLPDIEHHLAMARSLRG
jgi:putative membrane protein